MGVDLDAHLGTIIIGQFSDLIHAVGSGTGVRFTAVFCQHEDLVTGVKRDKAGKITHILSGERRSKLDIAGDLKHPEGNVNREKTAVINCLREYEFI